MGLSSAMPIDGNIVFYGCIALFIFILVIAILNALYDFRNNP